MAEIGALELEAQLLGYHLRSGQRRDVAQHGFPPVAEARGLHRTRLQRSPQIVQHQRRQRLGLHILGNDQNRLAALRNLLEYRKNILHARDLLVVNQNVGVLELGGHPLAVCGKVGRYVPAVELHPLDELQLRLQALRFLDRNDAVLAHAVHGIGDERADRLVRVRRKRRHLGDFLLAFDLGSVLLDLSHRELHRPVHPPLELHRVHAGGHALEPFLDHPVGKHRCGRGSITCNIIRLRRHFLQELRPHVLIRTRELDLLGNRDPVVGDRRCAPFLAERHVATTRPERYANGAGHRLHALEQAFANLLPEHKLFRHTIPSSPPSRVVCPEMWLRRIYHSFRRSQYFSPRERIIAATQ